MNEVLQAREERYWDGVSVAYKSNVAYDRWKKAEAVMDSYVGSVAETPEIIQAMEAAFLEVLLYQLDYEAYCEAAGALLVPKQLRIVSRSSEVV